MKAKEINTVLFFILIVGIFGLFGGMAAGIEEISIIGGLMVLLSMAVNIGISTRKVCS